MRASPLVLGPSWEANSGCLIQGPCHQRPRPHCAEDRRAVEGGPAALQIAGWGQLQEAGALCWDGDHPAGAPGWPEALRFALEGPEASGTVPVEQGVAPALAGGAPPAAHRDQPQSSIMLLQ